MFLRSRKYKTSLHPIEQQFFKMSITIFYNLNKMSKLKLIFVSGRLPEFLFVFSCLPCCLSKQQGFFVFSPPFYEKNTNIFSGKNAKKISL